MNIKKKVSGSWTDVPHYIASTDTETITTLPATIYPLGQSATLGLKGYTVQNGTPTPANPVPVIGVGDLDNANYNIPILSAGQTTNVYLGDVETTRKIRKLVLTGEEDITSTHLNVGLFNVPVAGYLRLLNHTTCICTHYIGAVNVGGWAAVVDKTACFYAYTGTSDILSIRDSTYSTIDAFKTYLSQQYAAGTPVCVWYVLTEATTGIVNEPLMTIGDYADSIIGISIPATAGANTLDMQTTLNRPRSPQAIPAGILSAQRMSETTVHGLNKKVISYKGRTTDAVYHNAHSSAWIGYL